MNEAGAERLIRGRYRLGRVLGRGGMGIVWQAHDELLSRDVAVKELVWPAHMSEEERQATCRRATREAQVAARLSHRNVVRVYDVVEEDGRPWIVMELLPPRSLRDLIKHEGPLGPAHAARIGLDILAALRAAHAAGVLHLDVKPANIVIDGDRAVLADFGIARDIGPSAAATTAGLLIGSPSYIAPERARGGRPGPAADLWGLGASLYAAVEGRGPFDREGGALASLTAAVADEAEPALHAGPLLWPVISGLLRKDPNQRLDAAAAWRMLRRVAYAPAVAAAPPAALEAPRSVLSAAAPAAPKARRSVLSAAVPTAPKARRSVLSAAALAIVASGISAGIALNSSPQHATAVGWPAAPSTHLKAPGGSRLSGRPQQAAPVRSAASHATGAASGRATAAQRGAGIQTESLLSSTSHAKAQGNGHARHARRPGPSSGPKHAKGKANGTGLGSDNANGPGPGPDNGKGPGNGGVKD